MFAASSTASPQYRAYGGCTSAGCIPATIVPMTSGFWPNGDVLVGLQTQEQLQNQNQQQGQRDDTGSSGSSGSLGSIQSNTVTSTPTPVIYIARAGSDQYKYSPVSSTPSPVGSGVGWGSAGLTGNQGSQGSSQFGNAGMQNQGTFGNTGTNTGFQGQNSQNLQNQGSSGFQNNGQNVQNTQNPFSQSNGQFGSGSQNQFGSSNTGTSGFSGSSNSQSPFQGSQNNLPFGPNMMPSNGQFGPQPRPPPRPFSENDWNFHPGSQGVHFVGNGNTGQGQVGNGVSGMTDEAQQIAVQIQAIRDNLSITRDESNYLINQLKASLPPDLQNQLQSV